MCFKKPLKESKGRAVVNFKGKGVIMMIMMVPMLVHFVTG